MNKLFLALKIIFLGINAYAQDSTLLYTLQENERIIYRDENRLLLQHTKVAHLMFLERPTGFFILYDQKQYGPFKSIQFSESESSIFDWAVSKEGKWYQLVLDRDALYGPYDEVVDAYRSNDPAAPGVRWPDIYGKHFGFRFKRNNQWFVNVDGVERGPYPDLDQGYPRFRETSQGLYAFVGGPNIKDSVLVDSRVPPSAREAKFWNSEYISKEGKKVAKEYYSEPEAGYIYDTEHYYYQFLENDKYYYYVSSLSNPIGPFVNMDTNLFLSKSARSYAYSTGSKINVNGEVVHARGFALTYDPQHDTFSWLTVSGRSIYMHRIKA